FPAPRGVAIPPGLRLPERRQLPSIRVDESQAVVGLPCDDDQLWRLNDLPRVRVRVERMNAQGQAVRVRIVDAVRGAALLLELRRPGGQRQTALQVGPDIPERRNGRRVGIGTEWFFRRSDDRRRG